MKSVNFYRCYFDFSFIIFHFSLCLLIAVEVLVAVAAAARRWRESGVEEGLPSRETHTLHFSKQAASGEPPSIMSLWR